MAKRTRKKTTEEKYQVDMEKDGLGGNKTSKTVDAADAEGAIRKAKQGDPTKYDNVSVSKGGTSKNAPNVTPRGAPDTTSKTGVSEGSKKKTTKKKKTVADPETFEIVKGFKAESISYPYCIVLPEPFRPVLDRVISLKKANITESRAKGKVCVLIEDVESMNVFMEKMSAISSGKDTKKSNQAKIIIDGIVRSTD